MSSGKSPKVQSILDAMSKAMGGPGYVYGACAKCGCSVDPQKDFKDEISRREYGLSKLCQRCQNVVFKAPDEKAPEGEE